MGDGNSFPLVVCVFQVILAYESIVLCMCSGNVLLDSGCLGKHAPKRCLTPERESTSHRPHDRTRGGAKAETESSPSFPQTQPKSGLKHPGMK